MNRLVVALSLVALLGSAGCLHAPGGVAASNIPLAPDGYSVIGKASGTDCLWSLLGILPVTSGNKTSNALEEALSDRNADALIQVTADAFTQHFLIVARTCTEVEGIAVRLKR